MITKEQLIEIREQIIESPRVNFGTFELCMRIVENFLLYPEIITDEFKEIFGEFGVPYFVAVIHTFTGRFAKETFEYISKASYFCNDEGKIQLINAFFGSDRFYNNYIGQMINAVFELAPNDEKFALELFDKFKGYINVQNLNTILSKISGGDTNPVAAEICKKCKLYQALKYRDKLDNPDERMKFFKLLGKMPSLIEKINFTVDATMDDLSVMPSVARFKFLQYYFRYNVPSLEYVVYKNDETKRKKVYIMLPLITLEDIKQLLFSTAIKKNADVSLWLKGYEVYLKNREEV